MLAVLLRWGANSLPLDRPNDRSLHVRPVPRIGGVAIALGCTAGWLVAGLEGSKSLWAGLALLFVVSGADDVRGLAFPWRLTAHVIAAALVVIPLAWPQYPVGVVLLFVMAIAWLTNLYNFMDGSDGLAGGMAVIGFGTYGIAAWSAGATGTAMLNWVISGAALAFLRFNVHPARVFLGDAGSIPLGFLAGSIGLIGWTQEIWPVWFPLVVFFPFIADATVTLARRLLRGERVWEAHRNHYYQRVVQMGYGHTNTALVAYALMVACAAAAIAFRTAAVHEQGWMIAMVAVSFAGLMISIDRAWKRSGPAR